MILQQSHYFLVKTGEPAKHKLGGKGKPKGKQYKMAKADEMDQGKEEKKAPLPRHNPPGVEEIEVRFRQTNKGTEEKR